MKNKKLLSLFIVGLMLVLSVPVVKSQSLPMNKISGLFFYNDDYRESTTFKARIKGDVTQLNSDGSITTSYMDQEMRADRGLLSPGLRFYDGSYFSDLEVSIDINHPSIGFNTVYIPFEPGYHTIGIYGNWDLLVKIYVNSRNVYSVYLSVDMHGGT